MAEIRKGDILKGGGAILKNQTVREIITKHVKDGGYDGLAGHNCGCYLNEESNDMDSGLIPCNDNCVQTPDCVPGYYCDLKCDVCQFKGECILEGDGIKCIVERVEE